MYAIDNNTIKKTHPDRNNAVGASLVNTECPLTIMDKHCLLITVLSQLLPLCTFLRLCHNIKVEAVNCEAQVSLKIVSEV